MMSRVINFQTRRSSLERGILHKVSRKYSYVNFPQGNNIEPNKPTLSQFKNPLFHCFLVASTTYIVLHTVWTNLNSSEKEERFIDKTKAFEDRIQQLVDKKRNELESKKSWSHVFKFWK